MDNYRIVPIGRFTIDNNTPQIVYKVQKEVLGIMWFNVGSKWLSVEEAEAYINSVSKIYQKDI